VERMLSLEDRLVFFFKKDSLNKLNGGIGNALFKALSIPFFIYFAKEHMGNIRDKGSRVQRAMPALKALARRLLMLKDAITPLMSTGPAGSLC